MPNTSQTVNHPLFARIYARMGEKADDRGQAEHRRGMLAGLSGTIVEVGAGNGLNFPHYPASVKEVLAIEPEEYLRERARTAAERAPVTIRVLEGVAEELPLRILAREPQDEAADFGADGRVAWPSSGVGPAPRHEVAVPAQQRVRSNEERAPAIARQEPARGGKESSIRGAQRGSLQLAAKDRKLVAEDDDLQFLELLGAAAHQHKREDSAECEVDQRSEQSRPPCEREPATLWSHDFSVLSRAKPAR